MVGAGCFVMSCYGLANLPFRPWALALLVLALEFVANDWQGWSFVLAVLAGHLPCPEPSATRRARLEMELDAPRS